MKLVNSKDVAATLIARQKYKSLNAFLDLNFKYSNMSITDLKKEFALVFNENDFDELFSNNVKWYEIDLKPSTSIINKSFDTLLNKKGLHNFNLFQVQSIMNQFSKNEIETVDKIRHTLSSNPRVIITTTDWEEFNIYDGWHTSLAFLMENCLIPSYVGHYSDFGFYY